MYWESRKGKAGWSETSYTSSCSDPAGELSPSEGVDEHSFLFREEEEEAMEYLCKHNEVKEKERDRKKKERQKEGKRKNGKVKKDF